MKKRNKALLLVMCAVILVVGSIMGTIAYLTDTETVTNTFTVGSVGLKLDEAKVNKQGQPLKGETVVDNVDNADRWQPTTGDTEQKYHLLPGQTYTKDPTVTVDANSEESYVRMMATITYQAEADAVFAKYGVNNWLNIDGTNWIVNGNPETTKDTDNGTISRTYEFRYKTTVTKSSTATELPALFTTLTVPGGVTNEEIAYLADMSITVEAHAIQAAGFDNADAAWAAFGK